MKTKKLAALAMAVLALALGAQTAQPARGIQLSVQALSPGSAVGSQYLVLIAIDKYREWLPLRNPVGDSRRLKEALAARYYVDKVYELYDEEATKAGILKLFERLIAETKSEDSVCISYAGHGNLDKITDSGFWIPVDGGADKYEQRNWLSNSQVRGFIRNMKSRHVLLLSDSCFSGDILNPSRGSPVEIDSAYFKNAYARVSRQVLTSGASEVVPDASQFAAQLLMSIEGNSRPYLDPLQLFSDIRLGMTKTTPLFGALAETNHQDGGSFLFFLRDASAFAAAQPLPSTTLPTAQPLPATSLPAPQALPSATPAAAPGTGPAKAPMVGFAAGTFMMGTETGRKDEAPVHSVSISRPFLLAAKELSFGEYDAFCAATGRKKASDQGWGRGELPAINLSWFDAVEYCNWLSRAEGLRPAYTVKGKAVSWDRGADGYRLPTEAEWEYAARSAGADPASGNGADPSLFAWFFDSAGGSTHPAGSLFPNRSGLFDTAGNVWEWVWDWFGPYAAVASVDPAGPASGSYKVRRGASWKDDAFDLRPTRRNGDAAPGDANSSTGFRIARNAP